jgi:hypothetical protein
VTMWCCDGDAVRTDGRLSDHSGHCLGSWVPVDMEPSIAFFPVWTVGRVTTRIVR